MGRSLSAIARKAGCSKSVISTILHLYNGTHSFRSPKKAGRPPETNAREGRIMWRNSVGCWLYAAAGIVQEFSAERGKGLSRHTVSTLNRIGTESPLCSEQTSH